MKVSVASVSHEKNTFYRHYWCRHLPTACVADHATCGPRWNPLHRRLCRNHVLQEKSFGMEKVELVWTSSTTMPNLALYIQSTT